MEEQNNSSKSKEIVPIFKKPLMPTRARRKQQKILDEETYIEKMGKIIERDFFPDLEQLRSQNDYLEAVRSNDVQRIRELYMRYTSNRPDTQQSRLPSPATFETPRLHQSNSNETNSIHTTTQNKMQDKKQNLDGFLSTHTSQDNESFAEILEASEMKHREKFHYLYNEEEKSFEEGQKQLVVPSIEAQCEDAKRPFNVDTWSYRNHNYIMFTPNGVDLTDEQQMEKSKNRQIIDHKSTRLTQNPFGAVNADEVGKDKMVTTTNRHLTSGKVGVDGKEIQNTTPHRRGYTLINTPQPEQVIGTPLMTWGEIEGTPLRLNTPSFRMSEPSPREQLAHTLADRSKKNRAAQKRQTTPLRRSHLPTISPSARRLAARYKSTPTTTTPKTTSTPKNLGIRKNDESTAPPTNLTNDLLQIELPKRQKASDFF